MQCLSAPSVPVVGSSVAKSKSRAWKFLISEWTRPLNGLRGRPHNAGRSLGIHMGVVSGSCSENGGGPGVPGTRSMPSRTYTTVGMSLPVYMQVCGQMTDYYCEGLASQHRAVMWPAPILTRLCRLSSWGAVSGCRTSRSHSGAAPPAWLLLPPSDVDGEREWG